MIEKGFHMKVQDFHAGCRINELYNKMFQARIVTEFSCNFPIYSLYLRQFVP